MHQACTHVNPLEERSVETTDEHVYGLGASERALMLRQARPGPGPGTMAEADALALIDDARRAEMYPQSRRSHKARARKHWGNREHQLGG